MIEINVLDLSLECFTGYKFLLIGATTCGIFLFHHWLKGGVCQSTARLDGKTVIITGGNAGIGKEVAKDLVSRGAKVIIACRDIQKGQQAASEIYSKLGRGSIITRHLDLASLKSIHAFVDETLQLEKEVHILINNAGIASCPKWKTQDGYEMQFGVNHLGHFLLTLLLLNSLKASAPSRIINVSSIAHIRGKINFDDINYEKDYNPFTAYFQSKLANVLFTRELARRLAGTRVTVYCLHPGAVHTGLGRYLEESVNSLAGWAFFIFGYLFFKSPKQGAQTTIYCAVAEGLQNESGYYYRDCHRVEPAAQAKDDSVAKRLWELSEKMVGISYENDRKP